MGELVTLASACMGGTCTADKMITNGAYQKWWACSLDVSAINAGQYALLILYPGLMHCIFNCLSSPTHIYGSADAQQMSNKTTHPRVKFPTAYRKKGKLHEAYN
jgi:hypothetical protein